MKKIYTLLFILLLTCSINSTPQVSDLLVYKGDTLNIYPLLLQNYIARSPERAKIMHSIKDLIEPSTASCGYRAIYQIRNDSLFLMRAYGKADIDLTGIFGKKSNIFIDWFTGALTSPENNLIYDHSGWGGYYEYETDFDIQRGILTSVNKYHNNLKPSVYTNQDTLMKFIKSNINYENIQTPEKKIRVILRIDDVNEDGKITKVKVLRGHEGYNEEAVRVVKSIPQWQVIIRRGKKQHIYWSIPVTFEPKN